MCDDDDDDDDDDDEIVSVYFVMISKCIRSETDKTSSARVSVRREKERRREREREREREHALRLPQPPLLNRPDETCRALPVRVTRAQELPRTDDPRVRAPPCSYDGQNVSQHSSLLTQLTHVHTHTHTGIDIAFDCSMQCKMSRMKKSRAECEAVSFATL